MKKRSVSQYGIIRIALALVLLGLCYSTFAAQTSEEESRQGKIDSLIRVAQVYIQRGMYQDAQDQLEQIKTSPDYASYLTAEQSQTIKSMLERTNQIIEQRQRIEQILNASDELSESGDYPQALQILEQIRNSPYVTDAQRQMIAARYDEVAAKVKTGQQKWQSLYEASVRLYNAGKLKEARQGFVQIVNSGYQVNGAISPEDYILRIDTGQKPAETEQEESVETLIPLVEEPQAGMNQEPQNDTTEEIEPMEMLPDMDNVQPQQETPTTPQQPTNLQATLSAQPQQEQQEESYLNVINRNQERIRSYTKAVVNDALEKAEKALAGNDFDMAKQAIRRGFSMLESNKMLFGNEQYKAIYAPLASMDQQIDEARITYNQRLEEERQRAADELTQQLREDMDAQRKKAVENYMNRAFAFIDEQRFEEALGQLEQLLTVDPLNQHALILKKNLENNIRYIEQRSIIQQGQDEELKLLLEAERRSIPFASEINYPRNWKEIAARREAAAEEGLSAVDVAVNMQLDKKVDLSSLTEDTTFEEAIDIIRNSVDPPLTIFVLWRDLSDNAFIEKTTPINMSGQGLTNIVLRTALDRLLQTVSSGGFAELDYIIEEGNITIATVDSLPTTYRNDVYDVRDLLNPPANGNGGGGGYGGGGYGGGGYGGGGYGGGGYGGGGYGGGGYGGGGYGGSVGNWQSQIIAYQLIYTIQQTIEPDTWLDEGGEGRIDQYSSSKLIIWQTPEVQKKIADFLEELRSDLGQQIAIETRFLLVDENFLQDIGMDVDMTFFNSGTGDFKGIPEASQLHFEQDSYSLSSPTSTNISSTLGGLASDAFKTGFQLDLDDLQVDFIVRATQAHRNARTLTAPKVAVLNGEQATINVTTEKALVTDSQPTIETIVTDGGGGATTVIWEHTTETVSSGVQLYVSPVITADKKYVLLGIQATLTDILAETEGISNVVLPEGDIQSDTFTLPTTQDSSVQTRVTVPDRGTILLGGLTLSANREVEYGTPFFSKIPLLGRLFSNSSVVRDKQILLIMVKPTIVLKDEAEEDAMAALEK